MDVKQNGFGRPVLKTRYRWGRGRKSEGSTADTARKKPRRDRLKKKFPHVDSRFDFVCFFGVIRGQLGEGRGGGAYLVYASTDARDQPMCVSGGGGGGGGGVRACVCVCVCGCVQGNV